MPTEKQLKNLKPLKELTPSEQREFHSKGGKASAKKAKLQRSAEETAKMFLHMALKEGKTVDVATIKDFTEAQNLNLPVMAEIILVQIIKALNGDRQSAEFVVTLAGEKPAEKQDISVRTIDKSLEAMEAYFNDDKGKDS